MNELNTSTSVPEGLRERKKRESKEAMHRAALELVSKRGLADVTVDQIAELAGVSPRTFFNYWGSKEAAVLGITPADSAVQIELLRSRPENESPGESMRVLLRAHLENATPDRSIRKLKRAVLRREPHLTQEFLNRHNDIQRELIDILAARLSATMSEDDAHDLASLHVFWCFAMSRAVYAISMKRDIALLDALPLVLDRVDSGELAL